MSWRTVCSGWLFLISDAAALSARARTFDPFNDVSLLSKPLGCLLREAVHLYPALCIVALQLRNIWQDLVVQSGCAQGLCSGETVILTRQRTLVQNDSLTHQNITSDLCVGRNDGAPSSRPSSQNGSPLIILYDVRTA